MTSIRRGFWAIVLAWLVCANSVAMAPAQGPRLEPPLGPPNAGPIAPSPPYAGQPVPPYPDAGTLTPAAPGAVPIDPTPGAAVLVEPQVVEVRIVGNETVKTDKVLQHIRTRADRPFRMDVIERDVRELNKTGLFVDIRTSYQEVPGGRVVIFEVVERPTLRYVKYVGWQKVKEKTLAKESGLKAGAAADPYAVEEARRTLEEYYHEKGFGLARVTIKEGNKPGDRGAIFVIHEGPKQKVAWTGFIGNTIANDDRLRTQIQSKQGIFWVFKGEFSRKEIEEDKNRLTAYYRGLGFFRARVGDEVTFSASQEWAFVTFVIDEGPRYTIRDISCIGNTKFLTDDLVEKLKLRGGEYFNQAKMDADIRALEEKYGSVGYIFTDVKAEPRFLERPGELDIVYEFSEGDRYRVGKILPEIKGEYPHTKITTVLNRISLQPGDIVDIRELRASERRLQACGLFEVNPQEGVKPKIVFSPVDAQPIDPDKATEHGIARPPSRPDGFRGQSPDEAEPATDGWLEPSRQGAWPFFTRRR